ncbi:RNA polymerase sigma factor [Asticcacaulis sp. 201]|uniref:RNA polymerase sigma factor n=1 Tax=Asticcacaulis sp. 201 TaxID=3028787 RepID=UPI002916A194|nr:RNA polymerase sigma factor [Asticcacaulis sp. 201]MDV6333231.1 RNA polymerase sigma factor [Asticcacaulis sp. 201]
MSHLKERREAEHWYIDHVRPNERLLMSIARSLLRSTDDAQDAFQDMVAYIMTEGRWRAVTSPKRFMITSIRNRCLNFIRARKTRPMTAWPDYEDITFADQTPDALTALTARESLSRFESALARLPPQCQRAFTLRRVYGLKPSAIAQQMGCAQKTVKNHVYKGAKLVEEYLAEATLTES